MSRRYNVPCPNKNCGSSTWDKRYDAKNDVWYWQCANCTMEAPVTARKPGLVETPCGKMTKQQVRSIGRLLAAILHHDDPLDSGNYEIKDLNIKILDGSQTVSVHLSTGRKADEGTALSLFRTYRTVFVGERGGWSSYSKDLKTVTGWDVLSNY